MLDPAHHQRQHPQQPDQCVEVILSAWCGAEPIQEICFQPGCKAQMWQGALGEHPSRPFSALPCQHFSDRAAARVEAGAVLRRVGLGHHQPAGLRQLLQPPAEGPESQVEGRVVQARDQHVPPATDGRLAHLLRAQRPKQRAGGSPARPAPLTFPVELFESVQPQTSDQVLPARLAGFRWVEGAGKADLSRCLCRLVEVHPSPAAQLRQQAGEIFDAGSPGIGVRQADGEIEADQRPAIGWKSCLNPGQEDGEVADRTGRVQRVDPVLLAPGAGYPALVGVFAPVGMHEQGRG